ncbi:M18 family aminopeptidase [Anaerococcus sp. AGMB00486]|uniref:M18 family aminopeptidase n=2 Tax=Anaerococcus TaxID=165779 RepID=A0ABX2NBW7_9FIRM|nr:MULTISPECIES: M18 family aminopeptidase [Anaerococcus]MDY3006892.1 M18 family aminopeptidase [Anaerococcus porci]MSS77781.1 M18 family aminopeptidase [Anaerococcus porci]NVF12215.1 M18 family aminopeptidase [Anaerococcus faecalis]
MDKYNIIKDLLGFIDNSPLNYFAVENSKNLLKENSFVELKDNEKWKLKRGGKYFIDREGTALIAFSVGDDLRKGFDIIGSHTDSPTFKIKTKAEMTKNGFLKLNVEAYGGMIVSTWLDRTLSLAGKVVFEDGDKLKSKLVKIDRDLLTIANCAIHINRDLNSAYKYNIQDELSPILALVEDDFEKNGFLQKLIADEIGIDYKSIVDLDLALFDRQKGSILGANNEFIQVGRLDNLASVHQSIRALVESENNKFNVCVLNDNEEIGSRTRAGAQSPFLDEVLERISLNLGYDKEDYMIAISNSYLISADLAHSIHPNYTSLYDPTNNTRINKGIAIKIASNGAYSTNIETRARFLKHAQNVGANVQTFHNRSDKVGGSTIGPIVSAKSGIKSIDVGTPILAMHSIREFAGVEDHIKAIEIFKDFYNKKY